MSTLINPTWWLLCAALVLLACARDPRAALRRALHQATLTPVLVAFACATVANVGSRAMLGHVVPGDFVQEIVAARQIQAGTTMYPADVNATVDAWLAEDPGAIPAWLPSASARWLEDRQQVGRNRLVAQAHPPTLLVAVAPAIILIGPRTTYWLLTLMTLAAAVLATYMLLQSFVPGATTRQRVLAALVLLSWQPVLATVRDGQVSVLLGALLVLAWFGLRTQREFLSGIATGIAAALKLYPLLLLVPLARSRPAGAAALGAITVFAAVTTLLVGPAAWTEYARSAHVVGRYFAEAPHNLSLVARLAGVAPGGSWWIIYGLATPALVTITILLAGRTRVGEPLRRADVQFAAFVTLALLLSPVAWHHYASMLCLPLTVLAVRAWDARGRTQGAGVVVLALVLSIPDDAWRLVWGSLPHRLSLLTSPGLAVLALWASLLRPGAPLASAPSISPDPVRSDSSLQALLRSAR